MNFFQRKTEFFHEPRIFVAGNRHGALCESFPADRRRTSRLTVLTEESQDIKNRLPPATTNLAKRLVQSWIPRRLFELRHGEEQR